MSNYNTQLQSNNLDLQTVLQTLQTKAAGGEQATPVISVNSSNGLITATAGTKSATHQLAFQPAKTITPGTASQIAVSSGYYTGGDITVAGDSNLIASNIKNGVSIFGVSGTLEEGGNTNIEDSLVTRNMVNYTNDRVTTVGKYAFAYCQSLTTINLPIATTINGYAFAYCQSLTTINLPVAKAFSGYVFNQDSQLAAINLPAATSITSGMFNMCYKLTAISLPAVTIIESSAFRTCRTLSQLYLANSSVCKLLNSNAFSSTPYAGYSSYFSGTPYIYVPSSLLTSYQTATNWTYFSNYFSAVEG